MVLIVVAALAKWYTRCRQSPQQEKTDVDATVDVDEDAGVTVMSAWIVAEVQGTCCPLRPAPLRFIVTFKFSKDPVQVMGRWDAPIHQFFLDVSVMRLTCIVELRDRWGAWGADGIVGVFCPVEDWLCDRWERERCECMTAVCSVDVVKGKTEL